MLAGTSARLGAMMFFAVLRLGRLVRRGAPVPRQDRLHRRRPRLDIRGRAACLHRLSVLRGNGRRPLLRHREDALRPACAGRRLHVPGGGPDGPRIPDLAHDHQRGLPGAHALLLSDAGSDELAGAPPCDRLAQGVPADPRVWNDRLDRCLDSPSPSSDGATDSRCSS